MKKTALMIFACTLLAFTSCKSNQKTTAGDSTSTGAGGARQPGNVTADTTNHDSTATQPTSLDTAKK